MTGSACDSATTPGHSSNSDGSLPSVPEGNTEASFQGAGHDGGHLPQTSVSHVSIFSPKEDQVAIGAKTSAQNAVGELQRPTNSVECSAQTCDEFLPRRQSDARAINRMRVQLFRKADTVKRLQRENSRLKKKLIGYENNTVHSAIRKCSKKVGTAQFCLEDCLVEQITNATRQRPAWSPDFVRECVLLYYLSPKAYRYIRNRGSLKLPSKNTLLRYVGKSNGESGVTPLMKERLKQEVGNLKEQARLCSIIVDEMSISSKYIYDRKMDCFFGQQTAKENNGAAENTSNIMLANKVLCFVATGLSTAYKIPCGFFFTNRLSGKLLYQLTKEVISEVENCGLCVLRIVTDNHKINVTMMRHLGNGSLKPVVTHPCDPERSLFLSFDQCHIIKNVRSLLLEGEMTDGSQPITGQFVKQLYELQKNEVVKPVRFLTQKHVEPTNFEKMHVGRAVQLFSDDVISALSFLKEYPSRHPQAEKFRNVEATILFMKMMQKWFAIHNVANQTAHVHMRQPDQVHFFCATDQRLGWKRTFQTTSRLSTMPVKGVGRSF
ncbi:hypothetical protein HPB51_000750 [Rhipicephalus microplus]|uniref:Transposable element n=1 Tax=Rhipicephalus microplus TaxID=6941 RepID=A0A9J6E582_RHIMP|nr:hypothetical protein HPB51_000750 [Rhipicephalus microplus]